mgnify:CR=1 FL=1
MDITIDNFIKKALTEDIGSGDITSLACIDKNACGEAKLITKEACKIAGINIAKKIYNNYDGSLLFLPTVKDGQLVKSGEVVFTIQGKTHSILATERLVLNCMQRMSGIATKTHQFISKIQDLNTIILDTRKTCPSIRFLDKEAVRIGGGTNHRYGLYDTIMIKDNHIDFSGSIEKAIINCHNYLRKNNKKIKIIIETRSLKELAQVLNIGKIDRILLDNFKIEETRKAVKMVNGEYPLESSGNININNIRKYALCGVEFISIGSLTHSVKNIDLSMLSI